MVGRPFWQRTMRTGSSVPAVWPIPSGRGHDVIAANLANANTPGYRAFDLALDAATSAAAQSVVPRRTDPRHLGEPAPQAGVGVQALASNAPARLDGNNVSLEDELLKLLENRTLYQTAFELRDRFAKKTFEPFTPNTVSSLKDLQSELAKVRKQGYAINDQQTFLGHRSIAVPLRVEERTVAALVAGSEVSHITLASLTKEFLPALRAASERLAQLAAVLV